MNQNDLDNIRFLLSRTPQQLKEWYNSVSDQDLIYASQIMDLYAAELKQNIHFQQVESQLETMPVFTEAQAVIAAIRG